MKSFIKYLVVFNLLLFSCNSNGDHNFDDDLAELLKMQSAIEELANSSICNNNSECRFISFGSKPCGGPWSLLIYSTSIDVDLLVNMVEEFNTKESEFNEKHNQVSDCSTPNPPTGFDCENNKCIPLY